MARKLMLFLFSLFIVNISLGQADIARPVKTGKHKAFIKLIGNWKKKKIRGYPIAINDSGMWITKGTSRKTNMEGKTDYELLFVDARSINKIYFRRKGTVGWSVLTGGIIGTVVGANIASASLKEPRKPLDGIAVVGGGMLGFQGGILVGALIGNRIRKQFNIGGDLQKFIHTRNKLIRYMPR